MQIKYVVTISDFLKNELEIIYFLFGLFVWKTLLKEKIIKRNYFKRLKIRFRLIKINIIFSSTEMHFIVDTAKLISLIESTKVKEKNGNEVIVRSSL